MKENNSKKSKLDLIIAVLAILLLLMGAGYAILSTKLYINGTAQIAGKWKIIIEKIEPLKNDTTAVSTKAEIINSSTATFSTDLIKPGDYMEYKVIVYNEGNIDAKLDSVLPVIINETKYIEFSNDAVIGEELKAGERTEIIVRVEFPIESEELVQVSSNYNLTLNYVQK